MKHQNIIFSIPEDLKVNLLSHVKKRKMSDFISKAIRKAKPRIRNKIISIDPITMHQVDEALKMVLDLQN